MSVVETPDWEFWEPVHLLEENLSLSKYARIRDGDKYQRHGHAERAQSIYGEECKRCDKIALGACAAAHEAESHRAQGDWYEAIRDYQRALDCFHSNDQTHNAGIAYLMLGLCFQAVAKYRDALDHFNQAHQQFDSLLRTHRGLGNARRAGLYQGLCEGTLLLHWQAQSLYEAAETDSTRAHAEADLVPSENKPVQFKILITRRDRDELKALGYSDEQIDGMRPEEAHELLQGKRVAASVVATSQRVAKDNVQETIPILRKH